MKFADYRFGGWLLIGLAALPSLSHAQKPKECPPLSGDKGVQAVQDLADARYEPPGYEECCAVLNLKGETKPPEVGMDKKVQAFTSLPDHQSIVSNAIHNADLDSNLDANSVRTKGAYQVVKMKLAETLDKPAEKAVLEKQLQDLEQKLVQERKSWSTKYTQDVLNRLNSPEIQGAITARANKKYCARGVDFRVAPDPGILTTLFSKNGGSKVTAFSSLEARVKEYTKGNSDPKGGNYVHFCSSPVQKRGSLETAAITESFDLNQSAKFNPNAATMPDESLKYIMGKLTEKLKSPQPGCVRRLKSVQIITSSDQQRNTTRNSWDFLSLSRDRAAYLEGQVKSMLTRVPSQDFKLDPQFSIDTNPYGTNGDGTSGACPYKLNPLPSGKIRVERDPAVTEAMLAKARTGQVNLEIVEEGTGCSKRAVGTLIAENEEYAAVKCFSVQLYCL